MAQGNLRGHSPVTVCTESYTALAPIYDRVMAHVEYTEWFGLLQRIIARYSTVPEPRMFEIGGGTGVLGSMLKAEGFRYCGSDLSPGMCSVAVEKQLPFLCADARALPVTGPFDLLFFLYDGINYFVSGNEYRSFFAEALRVLAPGGLLLFDVTTATNSSRYFSNTIDVEDFGDVYYIRHSYYDRYECIQHNDFTIFSQQDESELFAKRLDCHAQKIFSVDDIRSFVPEDTFDVVGIWDGYTFKRHNRQSERIHFLLRKRGLR
jgi:SAM-dependent methyltransferase